LNRIRERVSDGIHQLGGAPAGATVNRNNSQSERQFELACVYAALNPRQKIHHSKRDYRRLFLARDERSEPQMALELSCVDGNNQRVWFDRFMPAFDDLTREFFFWRGCGSALYPGQVHK
jgi:hypothetical protein